MPKVKRPETSWQRQTRLNAEAFISAKAVSGLTQADIAEKTKMHQTTVGRILRDVDHAKLYDLRLIADAIGVEILIRRKDE